MRAKKATALLCGLIMTFNLAACAQTTVPAAVPAEETSSAEEAVTEETGAALTESQEGTVASEETDMCTSSFLSEERACSALVPYLPASSGIMEQRVLPNQAYSSKFCGVFSAGSVTSMPNRKPCTMVKGWRLPG